MTILAIDPGNIQSGYVIIDSTTYAPVRATKENNDILYNTLKTETVDEVIIEMVAAYGMPAGATLFDTCVAIGRFVQICKDRNIPVARIKRKQYVSALCGSAKAKDANVIQYLIDRFAPNETNRGKGTKQKPGWFYGFAADIWQAYAIAVWYNDAKNGKEEKSYEEL